MNEKLRVVGGLIVVALFAAAGFLSPAMTRPSYEAALVGGLICPLVTAMITAIDLQARPRTPLPALGRGLSCGLAMAGMAYLVLLTRGSFSGLCDLHRDSLLFLLGPGIGSLLAGVWGVAAAELTCRLNRGAFVAGLLALVAPLGSAGVSGWLFYNSPIIFAFDPFVGYFSGALYDTIVNWRPLVTYRMASMGTLFACFVVANALERGEDGRRLRFRSNAPRGLTWAGGLCAMASIVSVSFGPQLGHWQTDQTVRATLNRSTTEQHCHIVHSTAVSNERAERFARDCNGHVKNIDKWLGLKRSEPVTVFLFDNAHQKKLLMGASRTSIAKPWRRELYVHEAGFPHPILGHELVHVLAADMAKGPFGVPGHFEGWIPNPGLIEGLAVAAAEPRGALTNTEWAAAMARRDILPRMESLFSLAFLTKSAATAYTAAGAFVRYVHDKHGAATIRHWYGGGRLPGLVDLSWEQLDERFRAHLKEVRLSAASVAQAKARFDRPGVLGRNCPHLTDRWLQEANEALARNDPRRAERLYRGVLGKEPTNRAARLGIAHCMDRGENSHLDTYLQTLTTNKQSDPILRRSAFERRGDLALRQGDAKKARADYERAIALTTSEGRLRTLEIKSHYAADKHARPALVALLVGSNHEGPRHAEALDRIGLWRSAAPRDGTPSYLLARQHIAEGNHKLAAIRLDEALKRKLPVERVKTETLRLRMQVACALEDHPSFHGPAKAYLARPGVSEAAKRRATALTARCQPPTPTSVRPPH